MSGMSHAKQAAARQECSTGILKSRRHRRGQRELKVAPGCSDSGFVGSVIHSYITLTKTVKRCYHKCQYLSAVCTQHFPRHHLSP